MFSQQWRHPISIGSHSQQDHIHYMPTRLEDIQELEQNLTIDGQEFCDKLRFSLGDSPARAIEAGHQCNGRHTTWNYQHVINTKVIVTFRSREACKKVACTWLLQCGIIGRKSASTAEIVIVDDHDQTPLLSRDTADALKVIKIGYDVGLNTVNSSKGFFL